jgi:predicted peroxiredoxin
MKRVIVALMMTAGLLFAGADTAKKESLFVNLTTSENIKSPMALMFAYKGLERGLDMTLLLNAEGVQLAVKGFESPVNARNGKTSQEMLQMFMKKGGKVLLCPMCLEAMGYTKENLIDGVDVSSADATFNAILSSDKIISY